MAASTTSAATAAEDDGTVWVGPRQGHSGTGVFPIYNTAPAQPGNPGTPDYWAYCIEHDVTARTGTPGTVGDPSGYLGENHFTEPAVQGKVLWVLAHSYPALSLEQFAAEVGVPSISQADAAEATQYAIWRYTELTFDAEWDFETPASKTAYWHLVNGANANPGMTGADFETTVSITGPTDVQQAGSIVGPFVVHTNKPSTTISTTPATPLVNATGTPLPSSSLSDGAQFYLDLRLTTTAGSAVITASANGSSLTGKIVSVPKKAGEAPSAGSHAQSIVLVAADSKTTTATADVRWVGPEVSTTLVDDADGDHVLSWRGGTVTDTVTYKNLVPGKRYSVGGELMRKSDGTGTGIRGAATFTATETTGSVPVKFTIPAGHDGEQLVAFQELFDATRPSDVPIAVHKDLNDAAQTITVEKAPATPAPGGPELAKTGIDGASATGLGFLGLGIIAGGALLTTRRRAKA